VFDPFVRLVSSGFSPRSAARLVALKRRQEHGEFQELTDEEKRFLFGRWLVTHGRVHEGEPALPTEPLTDFLQRCDPSVATGVSAAAQPLGESSA
jgi:hypothetical protein